MINLKKESGITLIALIITVIIMLILAGVVINTITDDSGLLSNVKRSAEKYTEMAINEEEKIADIINNIEGYIISSDGFDYDLGVNKPKIKEGMIPITYDNTQGWVVADKNNINKDWYDYENKKWANICTVDNEHVSYRNASVGTPIPVEEMTTMFVWIPRYAYSIVNGYHTSNEDKPFVTNANEEKNIEVKFLVGNTNTDIDEKVYYTNYDEKIEVKNGKTPMIVHPGFRFGEIELTGIWVAKFEASGVDNNEHAVGNYSEGVREDLVSPTEDTVVKILPNVVSWRTITIADSQYNCMKMSNNTNAYGWNNINTHLIKNSEWGAVAYFCYSKYGNVPMTNGAGKYNNTSKLYYDLYTGAGVKSLTTENRYENFTISDYGYNTDKGVLCSTTGNVYGIYDMAGGASEIVAAYIDNGNSHLLNYSKVSINPDIKYFDNEKKLKEEYKNYWDSYQVGEEEKNNSIYVEGESNKFTQLDLWRKYNSDDYKVSETNVKYNTVRKRLVDATYDLFWKAKGIGINEVNGSYSFQGVGPDAQYRWLINPSDTNYTYGKSWNGDSVLIPATYSPFIVRGGDCGVISRAGILYSFISSGATANYLGFRPAIVLY